MQWMMFLTDAISLHLNDQHG